MTDHHPITPPQELFKQWEDDILTERDNVDHVLDCAWKDGFRAGADQELEACHELLDINGCPGKWLDMLRAARRPKQPSLKAQALAALSRADKDALTNPLTGEVVALRTILRKEQADTIRRALEALDD